MYLEHFALKEAPFSLTPDTTYFLNRSGYQDALNVLLVALRSGEGFVKVVGEVGTGKTLLCRKLLNTLGDDFATAYIHNPYLSPQDLLHAVADELEVACEPGCGQHLLLKRLSARLVSVHRAGKRVVLCLDEVQAMPVETLETMRLLTNLETEKRKLLQVVLFGQPELDRELARDSVRPLDVVFRASGGVPRLVNVLCHKAMLAAYGKGLAVVDRGCARAAARDGELVGERRRGLLGLLRALGGGLGVASCARLRVS
jgi:MSHA biogenesis protein MshM